MRDKVELTHAEAEELRLAIKELGWHLQHMRALYNMLKPDNAEPMPENPNQLKMEI